MIKTKTKMKPDKEALFLHIFTFIKGLINVSQRNGVNNKKFIERTPVLSKLIEYIKNLNSQKDHEFKKIFETIQKANFLKDPKELLPNINIEVLSSGYMFVISAYMLRSKLGITENVQSNNNTNNGVNSLLNNLNNNNFKVSAKRKSANSTSSNLGSVANLGGLNNMAVSASKRNNNNNNNNNGSISLESTSAAAFNSKKFAKGFAKPQSPKPNLAPSPRTTKQGVKRTISAGTARKTRWDRKVKGNKERRERNAMKRRGMNRFASPVNNNNNNNGSISLESTSAAAFNSKKFAKGFARPQSPKPNLAPSPRTTKQGVKRTISAGTARKTRWDRKVKGNKERRERNAMKRRGMNRFATPVNNNNNNNNNDSESAKRRKIARNQDKFEEDKFNEIDRGGGLQNSPNNGNAFGDFRPRTTRQRVKRTISPGGARKTRWDRKVKGNKERKEKNIMKRRE
jgi:hypothetical protein